MIRQPISQMIWETKYRNGTETEDEFYVRLSRGLLEDISGAELQYYKKILEVDNIHDVFRDSFSKHLCSIAGRGLYGVGTEKTNQTFSSCFVLPIKKDSLSSIMETAKDAALTMKSGGGVGYSISILRPDSVKISSSGSYSSGAVSFLKIFDATCSVIKAGGDRRGAQLCALGVWHPSIKDFIVAKRKGGLTNFNLSVFISDKFMSAVENNEYWDLVFPDTKHEKYDLEWDGNIKLWQEKGYPVQIFETLKAAELFDLIMKSNYNFSEPGVLFEDSINKKNTLFFDEYILTTNPCVTGDGIVELKIDGVEEKVTIKTAVEMYKEGSALEILSYCTGTETYEYKKITFADKTREDAKLLKITDSETGKNIKVTPDHKIFTLNRGWVEAKDLEQTDELKMKEKF